MLPEKFNRSICSIKALISCGVTIPDTYYFSCRGPGNFVDKKIISQSINHWLVMRTFTLASDAGPTCLYKTVKSKTFKLLCEMEII